MRRLLLEAQVDRLLGKRLRRRVDLKKPTR
jgi:hypothetical protein